VIRLFLFGDCRNGAGFHFDLSRRLEQFEQNFEPGKFQVGISKKSSSGAMMEVQPELDARSTRIAI
jgi:hypothetical protein